MVVKTRSMTKAQQPAVMTKTQQPAVSTEKVKETFVSHGINNCVCSTNGDCVISTLRKKMSCNGDSGVVDLFRYFVQEFSRLVNINNSIYRLIRVAKETFIRLIRECDYKHVEFKKLIQSEFTIDFFKLIGRLEKLPISDKIVFI